MAESLKSQQTQQSQQGEQEPKCRPLACPGKNGEITPEMRAIAEALAHPTGDPYENGRRLGFYCENCG